MLEPDPGSVPQVVVDPSGINRLQAKGALPGWYRVLEKQLPGDTHRHTFYLVMEGGVFHLLKSGYQVGADGDSLLTQINWGRGMWLRKEAVMDTAQGVRPFLTLAQYQSGYANDAEGILPGWQSGVTLDASDIVQDYALTFKFDTVTAWERNSGSKLVLLRVKDGPPFAFNEAKGPAIPGGFYDKDEDNIGDAADTDIDGDKVPNESDCSPFNAYYQITTTYGTCTSIGSPSNLRAKSGPGEVSLEWNAGGENPFEVTFISVPAGLAPGGTVKGTGQRALVTGLRNGTSYRFQVRETWEMLSSLPSEAVECVPLAPPTELKAESLLDTLRLTWNDSGSAGFRLLYAAGDSLGDTLKATVVEVSKAAHALTGLAEGNYTFAVRAVSGPWSSALSPAVVGAFKSGMHEEGNATWASTLTGGCSLALQDDSIPVLLYSDSTQQNTLAVSALRGGQWVAQGAPGIRKPSRNALLRIAKDGTLYALFRNDVLSKLELVRLKSGGAWESAGLGEFLDNADWGFARIDQYDMAVGKDGTVYVAFPDPGRTLHLTVLRSVPTGWEVVDRRGFSAGASGAPRIALGKDDALFTAYIDPENGYFPVVKTFTGGHWESVGNTGTKAMNGLSLAIMSDGLPVVAFVQGDFFSGTVSVMRFDGTAWSFAGKQGLFSAREPVVAAGPAGALYLATETRYLYRFSGSDWSPVGPERLMANGVAKLSLAVDRAGVPYVLHNLNNGKGTRVVLRSFRY